MTDGDGCVTARTALHNFFRVPSVAPPPRSTPSVRGQYGSAARIIWVLRASARLGDTDGRRFQAEPQNPIWGSLEAPVGCS